MTAATRHLPPPRGSLLPALAFLLTAGPAGAQVDLPPTLDPGLQQERTLEEQERRREEQERRRDEGPVIQGPAPGGAGDLPETGIRFRLEAVRFEESAFLSREALERIAAGYVGREVSLADINRMIGEINALYAERGIVTARAIVPPQRIEDGVLRVRLVEGRLGEVAVDARYTRPGFVTARLPLAEGEVVDVPALREALLYFNRTAQSLGLQASLAPGAEAGETDVRIRVSEPPRIQGQIFADNAGAESTGEERLGAYLLVNGPLRRDDRLTAFAVGAEGAANGLLSYSLPVNRRGGRLEARYAVGDIEIVEGPFAELDITGDSDELALAFEQPVLRRDGIWLDGYLRGARVTSTTDLDGEPLSDNEILRAALGGLLQGFGSGYQWSLRQGVILASAEDILGVEEDYWFLDGSGSFTRAFGERWLGSLRAGWQYSDDEAVPATLLFQIGGVNTVRGYPEGALAGARGYATNLEVRYRWRDGLEPLVFLDHGLVDDVSPDQETLTSVGAGLRWRRGGFAAELIWGQTLEDVLPDQDDGRAHLRVSWSWP